MNVCDIFKHFILIRMRVHSFGKIDSNNVITSGKVSANLRLFYVLSSSIYIHLVVFSGVD